LQHYTGQQLGNYRILHLLGKGGSASVYLGEHLSLKSYAALKILHTHLTSQDTERFLAEARMLVSLAHPHIVQVLDFAVQDDLPFLVMSYAPGGTMRHRHPAGSRLPLDIVIDSVQQVASALQYAHDQRLIHRDIKPENMLIDAHQKLLLSDFGLSLFAPDTNSYTAYMGAQQVAGTPFYLAPEQLQGRPRFASDQYALAVVVYEWLCGMHPFTGTLREIAFQHLSTPPPSLRNLRSDISFALDVAVLRALAKEPEQRFPTVQAFASALQQAALQTGPYPITAPSETISSFVNEGQLKKAPQPLWKVPTFLTSLIGRERDTIATSARLLHPDVRLLTLLGPGGIGKTRLSLQVAAELRASFADGVCFVSLAALHTPAQMMATIVHELEVPEKDSSPLELVTEFLHKKQMLLILDNFEQIVQAASSLERLLEACSEVKILVTSRVLLRIQSEQHITVAPLALPDLHHLPEKDAVVSYASVALFVQRAQAQVPAFEVTVTNAATLAEICVRLDGLPLAIELAAARIKLLPPRVLLPRLARRLQVLTRGDPALPARQQTLRRTIQWSYDLLDASEQRLFRQLSIFVDGCTLETAEAMCATLNTEGDEESVSVLDGVDSLIEKSLLRLSMYGKHEEEPRLHMLETLREYALECLVASGEMELVQQAHADSYLYLLEEIEPKLAGPEQAIWLDRLEHEHENIRVALTWLFERAKPQAEQVLRMCAALYRFWWTRGYLREGSTFLERALSIRKGVAVLVQARVLYAFAMHVFILEGVKRAEVFCAESLTLYRSAGETAGIAVCLFLQGRLARNKCQYAAARTLLQEAVTLFKGMGNTRQQSLCLSELALVLVPQNEYRQAHILLEESLALASTIGDRGLMAWAHYQLALELFLSQADLSLVQTRVEESMALYRATGDHWHVAYGLNLLGEIHLVQGEVVLARALFEESMAAFKEMGSRIDIAEFQLGLARAITIQGEFATAHTLYKQSLAALGEVGDKEPIPACLEGLGVVMAKQGLTLEAARLWGRAEELRHSFGVPIAPVYRTEYEWEVTTARTKQGKELFEAAWAEGRTMPFEEMVAHQK
jgi:predicted ATPase